MSAQYRALHTILGLKPNSQDPTLPGELVELDDAIGADLLEANSIEEVGEDEGKEEVEQPEPEQPEPEQDDDTTEILAEIAAETDIEVIRKAAEINAGSEEIVAACNRRLAELLPA
jgi:hypothetical protein